MIPAGILLFILVILEGSFISFPFVLLFLVFYSLRNRTPWIFLFAFVAGLFLDALALRNLGVTSIFFLLFLFATHSYERKFEIGNNFFVFLVVALGSFIYLSIFQNSFVWQKTLFTVFVAMVLSKFILKPKIIV